MAIICIDHRIGIILGVVQLQQVYLWSKKIHNLMMWVVLSIGSGMMFSGLVMHRELEGEWYPPFVDTALVRSLHNKMATPFTLALSTMMVTGLAMWSVPKILSRRAKSKLS